MVFEDTRVGKKGNVDIGDLIADNLGVEYLIIFDCINRGYRLVELESMSVEGQYNSLMEIEQNFNLIASHEELALVAHDEGV